MSLLIQLLFLFVTPGIVPDSRPPVVRFEAFDFAFRGDRTASAGLTRVRVVNRGPSVHHVVLTKVHDDATVDGVMKVFTGTQPDPTLKDAGGPNMTPPNDSSEVIVNLKPGRYAVTCWVAAADGKPHVMKGMITILDVSRASATPAPEPKADLVLRAREYHLQFSKPPARGRHIVRFVNVGKQDHDVQIVRLRDGETMSQILKWASGTMAGSPPVGVIVGGISGVDNPNRAWFPLDLVPGRYAMFCFVPDIKDEKPHVVHGMWKEFVVR